MRSVRALFLIYDASFPYFFIHLYAFCGNTRACLASLKLLQQTDENGDKSPSAADAVREAVVILEDHESLNAGK